jgi:hypothetical protein
VSYGIGFRFANPAAAIRAAQLLRKAGLKKIEGFGPFPLDEFEEALGHVGSKIPLIALLAGIIGGISAYALEYFTAVIQYPLNIGGRPLHSWPAFIPVTFELTVLFSACAIIGGFLVVTGLPRLHHPVFEIPDFEHASDDRFYLCVEKSDPLFKSILTPAFIAEVAAEESYDIPS